MKKNIKKAIRVFIILMLFHLWTDTAYATEISIPNLKVSSGQIVSVPIMVNQIDNLAGVRIAMTYDENLLSYKEGIKSKFTGSFMHIVNSKNKGRLIIVMASAKGIKGKNIPIFHLTFESKKGLKKAQSAEIKITEVELMSDQLKKIKCEINVKPIQIVP